MKGVTGETTKRKVSLTLRGVLGGQGDGWRTLNEGGLYRRKLLTV